MISPSPKINRVACLDLRTREPAPSAPRGRVGARPSHVARPGRSHSQAGLGSYSSLPAKNLGRQATKRGGGGGGGGDPTWGASRGSKANRSEGEPRMTTLEGCSTRDRGRGQGNREKGGGGGGGGGGGAWGGGGGGGVSVCGCSFEGGGRARRERRVYASGKGTCPWQSRFGPGGGY